jgi:hypothetical protein
MAASKWSALLCLSGQRDEKSLLPQSSASSFDMTKSGVLTLNDKVDIRILQPLRVSTGGLNINLPTSYDYASGAV